MACFSDYQVIYESLREVPVEKQSLLAPIMKGVRCAAREAVHLTKEALKERTTLEIALGSVVLGTAAYHSYQYSLPHKIIRGCGLVVPGYRWICAKMGKFQVVPARQPYIGAVLESRRQGSEELPMTTPRNQVTVAIREGDVMKIVGCAVRMNGNVLVGPDHVLGEGNDGLEKCAKGTTGAWLSLAGKERIPLDADLVAIIMQEKEFSQLGTTNSNISQMDEHRVCGQIVGPDGKGTLGNVAHDAVSFGRIVYTGTTLQGYSGAAYMKGSEMLGIHQMGGAVNGGFSSSYVQNLILVYFRQKLESSPEWLLGQYEGGKSVSWRSTGDPDTIQIKVSGRYVLMDREEMNAAFGEHWRDSEVIQARREVRHRDYESIPVSNFSSASTPQAQASGESTSSGNLGASSLLTSSQGSELTALQALIDEYKTLSELQKRKYRTSIDFLHQQIKGMAGQLDQPQN